MISLFARSGSFFTVKISPGVQVQPTADLTRKFPVSKKSSRGFGVYVRSKTTFAKGENMSTKPNKYQPQTNTVARLRRRLQGPFHLRRTTVAERRSNPTFGPYVIEDGNIVRDSGTAVELIAR